MMEPLIQNYINNSELPILPVIKKMAPWEATQKILSIIDDLMNELDLSQYEINGNQIIHKSAQVEESAQLKGPIIIGPQCFVANGSLLRDGVILDSNCIVGHCGELKTSIMLVGSKIAHLNFVGDSILGAEANVEGGAIIANYRNEYENREICITYEGRLLKTGVKKFGAILGDRTRVGANAVIAPGSILQKGSIVKRGDLIDQCEELKL